MAQLLAWSKQLASELNQRAAKRTAKLANVIGEMREQIIDSRNIEAHLPENEQAKNCQALSKSPGKFADVAWNFANWRNFASQDSVKF